MPDALKDALALIPSLVCACVAYVLSFAISGALFFNLLIAAAAFAAVMWFLTRHSAHRVPVTAIGTACLLALALAPTTLDRLQARPAPPPVDVIQQIASLATPWSTVDPTADLADLEPLLRVWQSVRVVALGEATHGTSEFFRMKHRLIRFLVTRMGFSHLALEVSPEVGETLDAYVQGKTATNPVSGLWWPWRTREFSDLIEWLRQSNLSLPPARRLHVHGIDYQGQRRDFRMARNTLDLLVESGMDSRVILWAHNSHISSGPGWMGSYLKTALRDQIYLTGFEFDHGDFTSRLNWVRTYHAEPADTRFYADALRRTGQPILFLDFRTLAQSPAVERWLTRPHLSHSLQEAHAILRLKPGWIRDDESWPSLYDGIVYIQESTPAHDF